MRNILLIVFMRMARTSLVLLFSPFRGRSKRRFACGVGKTHTEICSRGRGVCRGLEEHTHGGVLENSLDLALYLRVMGESLFLDAATCNTLASLGVIHHILGRVIRSLLSICEVLFRLPPAASDVLMWTTTLMFMLRMAVSVGRAGSETRSDASWKRWSIVSEAMRSAGFVKRPQEEQKRTGLSV